MYRQRKRGLALPELVCLTELFVYLVSSQGHFAHAEMIDGTERRLNPQPLLASYNSTYGAPACTEVGSSCQTGDFIIAGVGSFEPNSPNTIDDCSDQSNAVYIEDEYVNRIMVRAKDGGAMMAGSLLQIHVTVSMARDVSNRSKPDAKETLHVYYASELSGKLSNCDNGWYAVELLR
mmetsp:Transcript_25418/g.43395  ORF Transcript_25418/g.43395 Transcript_25418/m.43395 type:complete len:177 (+) Transcript_25418:88-618(+)